MAARTVLLPLSRRSLALSAAVVRSSLRSGTPGAPSLRFRAVVDARASLKEREAVSAALPVLKATPVDFSRVEDVVEALDGCHDLVLSLGDDVALEEKLALATARAKTLEHVVKVSGPNGIVDQASPTSAGRAHWEIESLLRNGIVEGGDLAPRVSVVRAASSMQTLLEGRLFEMICGRTLSVPVKRGRVAFLHPNDLGDSVSFLLRAGGADQEGSNVEEGGRWTTYSLTGPEALSFSDVSDQLSKGIGERVRYSNFPLWAVQPALWIKGVSAELISEEIALARARESGLEEEVTSAVERLAGHPARTLLDFVKEHKDDWPRAEYR